MARIFLTHIPDMRKNYYGERALAARANHVAGCLTTASLGRLSLRRSAL